MTLTGAIRGFIMADSTLAAKVGNRGYPMTTPEKMTGDCFVTRIIDTISWSKLDGATDQVAARVEVTFWCFKSEDAEILANRLRGLVKGFNGSMSGVDMAVHRTYGPRSLYNQENRYYGSQLDIMAIVDLSTAS